LLVAAYRPEDVAHEREGKPHPLPEVLSEFKRQFGDVGLDLDRSAAGEGRRFVDALLDAEPNRLGEAFRQALFQRTEGHALFTVELLRDLLERGNLRMDEAGQWVEGPALDWERLPARVEGVIEKRMGRLPAEMRRALRVASVEGEEFTAEVVARVQGVGEAELVRQLSAEAGRGHRLLGTPSLQWLGAQPLSRYCFRHYLYQQYLYHTLDETERAYLHAAVGEALEALHADQVEPMAAQLARHFQAAGRTDKAVGYLHQAGERARRLWANQEAIAHFNRALALLHTLPGSLVRAGRELDLQLALGNALIAVKGYAAPEVGRAFSRARELCRQLGDTPLLFRVLVGLHRFYMVRGEVHTARELAEQILGLAQSGDDPGPLTEAHQVMGVTLFYLGEFAPAQAHFEQGSAHYDPERHPAHVLLYGEDPGVACLSYAAWIRWFLGQPDQAMERSREALTLARPLAHPFSLARALSFAAALRQFRREGQAAKEQAEAAIDLSTEHGFPFWLASATVVRGWALAQVAGHGSGRQAETAVAQIRQGLSDWQALGIELIRHHLLALLAEAYLKAGQAEAGLSALAEALPVGAGVGHAWEAELYRLKGELLLMRGKTETEAESCFLQALDIAGRQGAKSLELRAALSLCRWLKRQGRSEEARQRLAEIYGWFSEGFETPDLQEARALLEELSLLATSPQPPAPKPSTR
jgi:tetratricopeptide (TPR) repeat protein